MSIPGLRLWRQSGIWGWHSLRLGYASLTNGLARGVPALVWGQSAGGCNARGVLPFYVGRTPLLFCVPVIVGFHGGRSLLLTRGRLSRLLLGVSRAGCAHPAHLLLPGLGPGRRQNPPGVSSSFQVFMPFYSVGPATATHTWCPKIIDSMRRSSRLIPVHRDRSGRAGQEPAVPTKGLGVS